MPLAGSEVEQRRIAPLVAADGTGKGGKDGKDGKAGARPAGQAASRSSEAGGGHRADNAKISFKARGAGGREEQVTIEILRPAIPASVIALVARSGDRATAVGDTVTDTLQDGIMVMRSLALSANPNAKEQGMAATQMPFFRALVKGERQTPRPGRADDFRWPRDDDIAPPPEAAPQPAPTPGVRPGLRTSPPRGPVPKS
jgi:hypothetical protein